MKKVSSVWPRSGGLSVFLMLFHIGICSPGVYESPGWKGLVESSSSSLSSCSNRGSLSPNSTIFNLNIKWKLLKKAIQILRRRYRKHWRLIELFIELLLIRTSHRQEKPKLGDGVVLVPGSLAVLFYLAVSGEKKNYLVKNKLRAVVERLKKLRHDILSHFYDFFKYGLNVVKPINNGLLRKNSTKRWCFFACRSLRCAPLAERLKQANLLPTLLAGVSLRLRWFNTVFLDPYLKFWIGN